MLENLSAEKDRVKKKLTQIYTFLQSLDQLRNPVKKSIDEQLWKLWFGDLPEHVDVECDFLKLMKKGDYGQDTIDIYLRVKRPELTACPEPPEELNKWLKPGWHNIDVEPEVLESIENVPDNEVEDVELFDADATRLELYQQWFAERSEWKLREMPARQTMKVFERLYALSAKSNVNKSKWS